MKIGRNETCTCGSGKKYKLCCGAAAKTESPELLAWRRLRRAVENHATKLLGFIAESHGRGAIEEAWEEFTLWSGEPFDPESPQVTLFYPWLFHSWKPFGPETGVAARCLHSIAPSQAYLIAKGQSLDPVLYRYLSTCLDSPFGFFEVVSVDPGRGMQLSEILTETSHAVLERSASGSLGAGDIVYGMVVECDGVAMLEASAPVALPPRLKVMIVEERERLLEEQALDYEEALAEFEQEEARDRADAAASGHAEEGDEIDGAEDVGDAVASPAVSASTAAAGLGDAPKTLDKSVLARYDDSIRELYWDLVLPLLNPVLPEMHNTDDEPLSMQRLIFAIDSPAATFAALKDLAVGRSEQELLQDAQYDAGGALCRVAFGWTRRGNAQHKEWENTLLGHVEIDGTQLAAEVNSARRAAEFKRVIAERLGAGARYRVTEVQSMERLMANARNAPPGVKHQADLDQAELMARPEVQAQVRDMLARHYAAWVDESLPALKGKTPREAVRTAAGREKVEALIKDIERMGAGMAGYDASIADSLRSTLKL